MEESRNYKVHRTISPLPADCIMKYEMELRPVSVDGEFRVRVFGTEYKTSRKGKVLRLTWNGKTPLLTSLNQIEGFDYLTELTTLDLSGHRIKDISGLTKLKNLRNLYLTDNVGVDLKPLEQMPSLEKLIMDGNTRPVNIQSIGKLKNLTTLTLMGSAIITDTVAKDISFLKGLTKLQDLDLSYNRIEDISPLAGLYNLKKLNLRNNAITDISPLKNLTSLKEIDFYDNKINDVTALGNLVNLNHLMLNRNCVKDITPFTNLKNLQYLYLMENPVENFWPLEKLTQKILIAPTKREWPAIQKPKVESVENNGTVQNKNQEQSVTIWGKTYYTKNGGTELDLSHGDSFASRLTSLDQIQGLDKLTNLISLDVGCHAIENISALAKYPNLKRLKKLNLAANRCSDFSAVAQLTDLSWLSIWSNPLIDISFLKNLKKLEILILNHTKIKDISCLSELSILKKLEIQYCSMVTDISSLRNLKNLQLLKIQETSITDIQVLAELNELSELHMSVTKISDFTSLKQLKKLNILYIVGRVTYDFCETLKEMKSLHKLTVWNGKSRTFDEPHKNIQDVIEELKIIGEVINGPTKITTTPKVKDDSKEKQQAMKQLVTVLQNVALNQEKEQKALIARLQNLNTSKNAGSTSTSAVSDTTKVKDETAEEQLKKAQQRVLELETLLEKMKTENKESVTITKTKKAEIQKTDLHPTLSTIRRAEVRSQNQILIKTLKNPRISKKGILHKKVSVTWDTIYFGRYPQKREAELTVNLNDAAWSYKDGDYIYQKGGTVRVFRERPHMFNKKFPKYYEYKPIRWRVLDINNGIATLFADQVLDVKPFHNQPSAGIMTWGNSSLCRWLNDDYVNSFFRLAFSDEEKDALVQGGMRQEKVSLLYNIEILASTYHSYGFYDMYQKGNLYIDGLSSNSYTEYAEVIIDSGNATSVGKTCSWWLRDVTAGGTKALNVDAKGMIGMQGVNMNMKGIGVRPVITVDLNKLNQMIEVGSPVEVLRG